MKLNGKVVVVTGAGRGIGREISLNCARQGGSMVLAARSVEALQEVANLIEADGGEALVVETDVSDPDAVAALANQVLSRWGPSRRAGEQTVGSAVPRPRCGRCGLKTGRRPSQ